MRLGSAAALLLAVVLWAHGARADFQGVCPANTVVAGPVTGQDAAPACRLLVPSDVPPKNAFIDTRTGPITAIGSALLGASSDQATADLIESYVFCTAPGTATSCGGGNYDAVAGIGISNPGTTTSIVSGVAGYVLASQAFAGSGPSSVALFGTGAVTVDGGAIWGSNVNVSDRQYRVAQPSGTHNRRVTGMEIDVSVSYPDSVLTGLFVSGNSVVQPTNSTGFAVLGQDFSATIPGSIARWTQAFYTYPGVAIHFASIGTQLPVPSPLGAYTSDSQDFIMAASIGGASFQGLFYFGEAHPNFGSTTQPSFNMNYSLQVWTGGITARAAADQIVQLGGHLDLSTGALIESRNDAGSLIQPLEILAGNLLLNSNQLQVNNGGSGIQTAANCTGTPSSSFASVNGIVTHC